MNTDLSQRVCKALSSLIRVEILQFVRKFQPVSVRDVADAFFGSPERLLAARRHLRTLCDVGLCTRIRIGREYLYTYTGQAVASALVSQLHALLGEHNDSDTA